MLINLLKVASFELACHRFFCFFIYTVGGDVTFCCTAKVLLGVRVL
jgi:hypothetical protein